MYWQPITKAVPVNDVATFMVWGNGWRHPEIAAFDPDTGEFFDPTSFATHVDPTHWMSLPDPPGRIAQA